jgi:hypothetical protein
MTDQWFDVIDKHDFVLVSEGTPNVFEGVYVMCVVVLEDGTEKHSDVRLSRPDARALAARLLELAE